MVISHKMVVTVAKLGGKDGHNMYVLVVAVVTHGKSGGGATMKN